jgi:hypothetical protein
MRSEDVLFGFDVTTMGRRWGYCHYECEVGCVLVACWMTLVLPWARPPTDAAIDSVNYVREISMRKIWVKLVQLPVSPHSLFPFTLYLCTAPSQRT